MEQAIVKVLKEIKQELHGIRMELRNMNTKNELHTNEPPVNYIPRHESNYEQEVK